MQLLEIGELLEVVQREMDRRAGRISGEGGEEIEHGAEIRECVRAFVERGANSGEQGTRLGVSGRRLDRLQHMFLGGRQVAELQIDGSESDEDRQRRPLRREPW